ncbi:MAG: formylglycine-generating enzyme family protein, partial [Bacteroidales bacterium]|nr:formylglycine-generating enzyme family protein [Bacteroidales bacterium]
DNYSSAFVVDPLGPSGSPSDRVVRNSNWDNAAVFCRVSWRGYGFASDRYYNVGFRVRCRFF